MTDPWHPLRHPLEAVSRVFLELSNRCNLSEVHVRCPLHLEQEPKFLPSRISKDVMEYLGREGWRGWLSFNTYNEPTIDPRLFSLLEHAKRVCPDVKLHFITNGEWLDQTLLDELRVAGADFIQATAYTSKDEKRLNALHGLKVNRSEGPGFGLDERLQQYDRGLVRIGRASKERCYAPASEINVSCHGRVRLCCYDWREETMFGDLNIQTLDEVLRNPALWALYGELSTGQRTLPLCKGCTTRRGSPPVPKVMDCSSDPRSSS